MFWEVIIGHFVVTSCLNVEPNGLIGGAITNDFKEVLTANQKMTDWIPTRR